MDSSSPTSRKKRGDTEDSDNSLDFGMNFALGSIKRKRALLDQDLGQASEDTPLAEIKKCLSTSGGPSKPEPNSDVLKAKSSRSFATVAEF